MSKKRFTTAITYIAVVLVALFAIGAFCSLLSGNRGVVSPEPTVGTEINNGNDTENTDEIIESDGIESSDVSSELDESESIDEGSNVESPSHRIQIDGLYVNGERVVNASKVNGCQILDLSGYPLETTDALRIYGWFMCESGVSKYQLYLGNNSYTSDLIDEFEGTSKSVSQSNGAYLEMANSLGLGEDALSGLLFDKTLNLSDYAGQTISLELWAEANDGSIYCCLKINNIQVLAN